MTNIGMIQCVARGLATLKDEVAFIGGSVAALYAQKPELSDIRPTLDIDCVVEISTYIAYIQLEEQLRVLGFRDDTTAGAPVCRKIYRGITVDFMPINEDILGFSNKWYRSGMNNKMRYALSDDMSIFIFPVEYYIATKFEALNNRGGRDIRGSRDWEDIVYILTNSLELLQRMKSCTDTVLVEYLKGQCSRLLKNNNIREIIYASLPYNAEEESIDAVLDIINEIVNQK
jgi:hypothetical protein